METDLRVFKIFLGGIGTGAWPRSRPTKRAIAMHSGDSETSMVRHLAPELVHMDRAEGYVFDPTPDIGYSSQGPRRDRGVGRLRISPKTGGDRQPASLVGREGPSDVRGEGSRAWPSCSQAIYRSPKREIHLAPKDA